ncbi:helix-turn-helix domain-containing protein [Anaerocellum diazotrophicum]|uniref:Transcriptional regulator, AraC family n=1 Tax=Caldicellulosiruptor diazotrophicus TaxID=2806205 RepID=A0ABM7NQ42_9FIRM|nr:helix-turn-helix domain-containing protein [Caldicellulosiruptor diazotrophicus]BCS82252.1 hypothetical protein CaldiYA01_22120 [Caldicellulosiruptor diazotrophicus]
MFNRLFSKDIYVRIVISYIIIFTIIFLAGIYTYFITYKVSEKNLYNYTESLLNQLPLRIYDEIIKPLDLIQQSINRSPFYLSIFLNSKPLENKDKIIFEIRDFCNELKFHYTNPFLIEIGIYLPRDKIVITPNFFESVELFFNYFAEPISIKRNLWFKLLSSNNYNYFSKPIFFNFNKYLGNKKKSCIVYLHTLDNWQFDKSKATLFVLLDYDKLVNFLKDISIYKQNNIFIINSNGDIIVSYNNNPNLLPIVYHLNFPVNNINNITQIKYNGKIWKCFYVVDKHYWKYIIFIPSNIFFRELSFFRFYFLLFIFVSIITGIPLIVILSQKSYHPVSEIKDILFRKLNVYKNIQLLKKKESLMLKEIAQMLVKEEEVLKRQLNDILPIIQYSFIENLLKGNILMIDKNEYKRYQLNFISEYFCVILIEVNNINELSTKISLNHELLRFIVFNVFGEILSTNSNKCFNIILSSDLFAIVLNLTNDKSEISEILRMLEHAKFFLEQNFNMHITIGVSSIKSGINSISDCYKEAEAALKYKFVAGNFKIYSFDNLPKHHYLKKNIFISSEIENKIYDAVLKGDKLAVENLLELIYEKIIQKTELTPIEAKVLCIQIVIIFENACKLINYDPSENLKDYLEEKVISQTNNETIQNFFYKIKQMFGQITEYVEKYNLTLSRKISVEKIIEYINENYSNPNLSLTSIAEEFQISPQYLSSVFKEATGQKLSEYIINIRIEKAKYLLLNSNLSINEIAQKVGYYYPTNFINAFKKRVGISPAKFRIISNKK